MLQRHNLTSRSVCLLALTLPIFAHAQYTATLNFSNEFQALPSLSFSSNSPGVTFKKQSDIVQSISFALSSPGNIGATPATPLNPTESFTISAGAESLTFTFAGVFSNWWQTGQTAVTFRVEGATVPYYDVNNNSLALVAPQLDSSGTSANDLHLQFIPFYSDPAFSLLNAISQANGLPAPSDADRASLYRLNVGNISVSAVPEPEVFSLLFGGLACVFLTSRLSKRQQV